ncbi:MAG: histidine phosphatase family protein, partial [Candidatus Heimdallarchaeaceae archaeon]
WRKFMKIDEFSKLFFQKKKQSKFAVAIRHAEREEIVNITDSANQLLTDRGRSDSINLGKELPQNLKYNLYYSNVPRCKETAQLILKGIQSRKKQIAKLIGSKDFLGGFYLKELKKALQFIQKMGVYKFIVKWTQNEVVEESIMDFYEASKLFCNSILKIMDKAGGKTINIFVTHDWNLMLLTEVFLHKKDKQRESIFWPDFLEAVILEIDKKKNLFIYFRELKSKIQHSLND